LPPLPQVTILQQKLEAAGEANREMHESMLASNAEHDAQV